MKTFLDCVPCIINQSVQAPERFTDDIDIRTRIVREFSAVVSSFDMAKTPPELGGELNRIIASNLGVADPYYEEKRKFNKMALTILPQLRDMIGSSVGPFETAVRLCAAANIMDFGAPAGLKDSSSLMEPFQKALREPIQSGGEKLVQLLEQRAKEADTILYLADNAGEIVVDRLLIEFFKPGSVTVAVRSGPAINDALVEDAMEAGIHQVATVIESGAALPGTPLKETSEQFRELFEKADLVISKGQGNFETLSEETRPIYYLLTAKCAVVARHLGCEVGDFVVHSNQVF